MKYLLDTHTLIRFIEASSKISEEIKEAETVFDDKNAVFFFDEQHSTDEERFIIIGLDSLFRELTVCHCYRGEDDDVVRIISARRATENEKNIYYGGLGHES